jgi:UrcA family protein
MNITIRRLIPMVVLVAAMSSVAPCASAAEAQPSRSLDPTVTVHFADLNPSTPEGVRALYDRITAAAETVCGPSYSTWDSNAHRNWKICYRATIDHTVRQINRPQLTALHQKISGTQGQVVASATAPNRSR